ncbi:MAG: peroxiredoxin [Planctomycetes bacterium]|nr:peroxiredoxin [Planctomycetota bacterium]
MASGADAQFISLASGSITGGSPSPQAVPTDVASPSVFPFREIDGTGTNPLHPDWGAANTPLLRSGTIGYGDGESTPAGATRPSAREVSNACVAQPTSMPAAAPVSDYVWQWGQFIDHDIDLTGGADPAEPFDIDVPLGDPWFDPSSTGSEVIGLSRSHWTLVGGSPVRQQVNEITAWLDASNVYGSDPVRNAALRLPDGRLATSPGNLLPFNTAGLPNAPDSSPGYFLGGDVRSNEQNGLTAMHTLFVREHNRLVGVFEALGDPPELCYEKARAVVGAEEQVITYNEFVPAMLGPDALPPYAGWNPAVDGSIENAFSTGCYRFGHTMLSPTLLRLGSDFYPIGAGNIELRDAFFNPQEIVDNGIEPLLLGLAMQRPQEVDAQIVDDVRNFLFGPPGSGGFDLASLNIQRGRDHGLASYNQTRIDFGLAPRASFAEISSDAATVAKLASVYATVDDIDLWVGMLAEDHVNGGLVGELAFTVLVDQFTRLRDGDRFWYELLPSDLKSMAESRTLADVIRDNTTLSNEVPDHVFIQAWTDLGASLAGTLGAPRLRGVGSLLPGSATRYVLDGARPSAPALFVLGFTTLNVPFKGGTMVPWVGSPLGVLVPFGTDPAGGAIFPFVWPASAPSGSQVWAQCWIADPGAPAGVAASNAVRGDSP